MELVRWQARVCRECPENFGCNENAPWYTTTPELKQVILAYYAGTAGIPQGTHIELLNVVGNRLNRYLNPNTDLPFREGDVVELLTPITFQNYGTIKSTREAPTVQGGIGEYWRPTHLPITTGGEDATQEFWAMQQLEAREMMVVALRAQEFDRSEEQAFADFVEVLKRGVVKEEIGPPADFTRGESFMKAGTGWRFLKNAGACFNPVRYIRAFPEEMPVAEIWHDYLRNKKKSPMGQNIEWYWVSTIINYVPGLLRECTERTAKWIRKNLPEYERNRNAENHHFDNEVYRHAFFDLNPWPEIEFRLRQRKNTDRTKSDETNGGYGSPRFVYTPNELDIRTGIHTMELPAMEDKPQEQEAAAAQAA